MIHDVRVWHGSVARHTYLDFQYGINEEVIKAYTRGQCVALALALHKRVGGTLMAHCHATPNLAKALGPYDELGHADVATLNYEDGKVGGEQMLRSSFMHAFVLTDQGALDIEGLNPLHAWFKPADAPSCACPPSCACRKDCCLGEAGMFFVRMDEETALRLDQKVTIGKLKMGKAVATQNHEAAEELADLVLDHYSIQRPAKARRLLAVAGRAERARSH